MAFGKLAIFFFGMLFMIFILLAVASVMLQDKPTDSFYTNNTAINKTSELATKIVTTTPGMVYPGFIVVIVLMIGGGFYMLARKGR